MVMSSSCKYLFYFLVGVAMVAILTTDRLTVQVPILNLVVVMDSNHLSR